MVGAPAFPLRPALADCRMVPTVCTGFDLLTKNARFQEPLSGRWVSLLLQCKKENPNVDYCHSARSSAI
jgi:hypothetical protein